MNDTNGSNYTEGNIEFLNIKKNRESLLIRFFWVYFHHDCNTCKYNKLYDELTHYIICSYEQEYETWTNHPPICPKIIDSELKSIKINFNKRMYKYIMNIVIGKIRMLYHKFISRRKTKCHIKEL